MNRGILAAVAAAGMLVAVSAHAALTVSETEQVRGYVASGAHADRVRALVARPDLSADESAAAMTAALVGMELDARRAAYLADLVANGPSAASRSVLAGATARGVLARADAVFAAHPADLDRNAALDEIARAYLLVATEAQDPAVGDAERALLGRALADHLGRQATLLKLDVPVAAGIGRVRAIAAVALYDSMPDGPTRRVDAADKLGLTGARRALLVETGVLFVDAGGPDARVTAARGLLERLPGARDGLEAIVVGDPRAPLRSRGTVATAEDAPATRLADATSPWAPEAEPAPIEGSTMAIARGLAAAAVRKAMARRPGLGEAIARDGGEAQVSQLAGMLAVDGERTIEVVAARSLAGKTAMLATLADAIGALAAFAPASATPSEGLSLPLGGVTATRVSLEPTGAATALRLGTHVWRFERDATGVVTALHRDGAPVTASMLGATRVSATQASSWTAEGLVFARLAGTPAVAISAGRRVRLVGSGIFDAVSAPGPGDDVTLEADLRVDGPAGVAVRTVPTPAGFRGVSLMLVPGAPMHAVLLAADGAGTDTAAAPVVEVPATAVLHVRMAVRGNKVEAQVGGVTLTADLPDDFAHGDVGLRAYPGATVEATGWRVSDASAASASPVKRKTPHPSSGRAPSDR
jgi:hypothetical protein